MCLYWWQAGFAAVDAVTGLKLIEGGLPRETIAFVALAAVPVQVLLPALLRYVYAYTHTYAYTHIRIQTHRQTHTHRDAHTHKHQPPHKYFNRALIYYILL